MRPEAAPDSTRAGSSGERPNPPRSAIDLSQLRLPSTARPQPRGGFSAGAAFLILVAGGLAAFFGNRAHQEGLIPWTRLDVKVTASRIARRAETTETAAPALKAVVKADGYIAARRKAVVGTARPGKVKAIFVEEGVAVVQSQVLAQLDDAVLLAELSRARANLREAKRELARRENLAANGVSSSFDRDTMESRVEVAEAEVRVAEENLDQATIRAPFDGVILAKLVERGENVGGVSYGSSSNASGGAGGGGIVTIADTSVLEIDVDVQEARAPELWTGQLVECFADAFPNLKIAGRVRIVQPASDRRKATVPVKVTLDHPPEGLRPDMGVKVTFFARPEPAKPLAENATTIRAAEIVLVPKTVVHATPLGPVVWVIREGRAYRLSVELGDADGDDVAVTKGLTGGEPIVVSDPSALSEGLRVNATS